MGISCYPARTRTGPIPLFPETTRDVGTVDIGYTQVDTIGIKIMTTALSHKFLTEKPQNTDSVAVF